MIEIVMATCNGGRFLEEQLNSLFAQSCQGFHLTVGDDCSADDTQDIVREFEAKYPGRVTLIVNATKLGPVGNFGNLMKHSSAEYVMFSDQDDIWLPNKIEKSLAAMVRLEAQHSKDLPILIYSDLKIVSKHLVVISETFWKGLAKRPREPNFGALLASNRVTGCTVMMNRALVQRAAPIPTSEVFMHDWWTALVASAFGILYQIEEPLLLYRQHESNAIGVPLDRGSFIERTVRTITQIGANPAIKANLGLVKRQAAAFERIFGADLPPKILSTLAAAQRLDQMNALQRRWTIVRHRLFRPGLRSNISLLIGV